MDEDDFLDAVEQDNKAGEVVEETIEQPVTFEEPKVETPAEPVTEVVEPVVEAKPEPGFIPFAAVLDEREKRKASEAELERLKAQLAQQQAPAAVPDMFEDPDGHAAYVQAQTANQILNAKLDLSEDSARDVHGDELIDTVQQWVVEQSARRPGFGQEVLSQRNPYKYAVKEYQKAQIADTVKPDEFAEFQAWKAAQARPAQEQPQQVAIPPRSLASAPSAGGIALDPDQSDEEVFDDIFVRK